MTSLCPSRLCRNATSAGWLPVTVASLVLAAAMAPSPSLAQGRDTLSEQRLVTVSNRPRPEYDPLGVRLGSFRLDAGVETGIGYDDNLFGTDRNTRSSPVFANSASAALRSQWTTHALGLTATVDDVRYLDQSRLDTTAWSVGGLGRYDIDASSAVEVSLSQRRSFLSVQTIDLQRAGVTEPLGFDEQTGRVTGTTRFNRLSVSGFGQVRHVAFEGTDGQGFSDNTLGIDYFSYSAGTTFGYLLSPGRSATLTLRAEEIDGEGARGRLIDSLTLDALVGFVYDFDGIYQASIGVGWARREYRDSSRRTIEGLGIDARFVWLPSQLTTVTLAVRRGVDDSVRSGGEGFLRTLGSVRVDHELQRNIIIGAGLSVERREYSNPSQRATDALVGVSAQWLINRNMSLIASYQHVRRFDTSAGVQEYDQNLAFLRLRFSL